MSVKRIHTVIAAVAVCACMTAIGAPVAVAANDDVTVTSSRSFPKAQTVTRDLFAEASAVNAETDEDWGAAEHLDVPQTQSQAEKDAEAAAAAAEEAERQAQEQAAQAESDAQAASRSYDRDTLGGADDASTTGTLPSATGSATGQAIAAFATQFQGYPYVYGGNTPSGWDCSGFVQYVFAQYGISLPHSSGAQAAVGTAVGSLAEAQPGDIIANGVHAAIYIGGGMVINALNPSQGTQITGIGVFTGGYSIRRVV